MTDKLIYATFEPLVNQPFVIHYGNNETLPVTLVEAKPWGPTPETPEQAENRPFSLVFQSTIRQHLPQWTFRVENEQLGVQEIFLVPLAPNAIGIQYQAIFNP